MTAIVKQTINTPVSKLSSRKQNPCVQETYCLSLCSSIQNNVSYVISTQLYTNKMDNLKEMYNSMEYVTMCHFIWNCISMLPVPHS